MKKIEPVLSQYRRNKDGDVSRWITAPDAELIAEMGYEVRHLYTREDVATIAEAVREEVIQKITEGDILGVTGAVRKRAKSADLSVIINNILGE